MLLLALFVFGVADIVLYLVFDARGEMLRALPGRQYEVVGKLPESVQNINILPRSDDTMQESQRIALLNDKVLAQQADAPGFSLRFLELRGRIWRAELTIGPDVPLGPHKLKVFPRETLRSDAPPVEPSVVDVTVYADTAAMKPSARPMPRSNRASRPRSKPVRIKWMTNTPPRFTACSADTGASIAP